MIKFCEKCGNRVSNFIKGNLINGKLVEDYNENLYGLYINELINLIEKLDTLVKYNVNHKEKMKQEIIIVDKEYNKRVKTLFNKYH